MNVMLKIVAGDLVLFPDDDKYNLKEQYGMILEVIEDYFSEPRDEEDGLDDGQAYRVEWMNPSGDTEHTIEDYREIKAFRLAFLNKHPQE
jgi:hypothetical protein